MLGTLVCSLHRSCWRGGMRLMQRNFKYTQEPVWICCSYEVVIYQT